MGLHGIAWDCGAAIPRDFRGIVTKSHAFFLGLQGIAKDCKGLHGIAWDCMGLQGIVYMKEACEGL